MHWYGGIGSNMRAETLALWGLLWFASHLCIEDIWVFGDSKVLIDYLNGNSKLSLGHLETWLERIDVLKDCFNSVLFNHIP